MFQDRYEILSQYRNRFGELPNSKRVLVEEIDKDLKELDELKDLFSPFSTYQENKLSVIYGVSDKHNLGVDITYSDNVRNSSKYRAKAAEFHHKHAFYQGNRFIVSLRSAISHNNYYYNKSKTTLKESLFLGISKKNKHFGDGFLEIGLHGSTGLEHANIGQHSIGFSFSQGAKILWGLELSNYSQVDYYKQDSKKSNAAKVKGEFFDQFSIAKEFNFANIMGARTLKPNNNNVTLQLGYFWKGVISQSNSIVSGPTISLWFTI